MPVEMTLHVPSFKIKIDPDVANDVIQLKFADVSGGETCEILIPWEYGKDSWKDFVRAVTLFSPWEEWERLGLVGSSEDDDA